MTEIDKVSRETAGRPSEKRTRLVEAARDLMHQQGVERTTLADVAEASGVPLGNVYYYFKTKNELVAAVVESRAEEQMSTLVRLNELPTPAERLKAFIGFLASHADMVAESGCPMGSLCSELDKREDGLNQLGAPLIQTGLDWVQRQFEAMGRPDARELAIAFVASYQGAAVLTNTLRDPTILQGESARVQRWVDSLAATGA
jgi:AcrR family transcriptional regulator